MTLSGNQSKSHGRNNDNDEKLWQDLNIDFRLEAASFPDNKIYSTVRVIPESSRKLIEKFILVVNNSKRIEFDRDYENLSASGFNTKRKNPFASVEAVPTNSKWEKQEKTSDTRYFHFTGEVFALSPRISFEWSTDKNNPKAKLLIQWFHIGDKSAHQYILYLDGVEVQHIRQKLIEDAFHVTIDNFYPGEQHTLQLAARLNNGKETYRSDPIEFIVPDAESMDDESIEFITVSNEPPPPNLPGCDSFIIDTDNENVPKNPTANSMAQHSKRDKTRGSILNANDQQSQTSSTKLSNHMSMCDCRCDQLPHKTFPGIEHYLRPANTRLISSALKTSHSKLSPKRMGDDTDDDDVIMLQTQS